MKALLVCTDFPPATGGIQTMMGSMAAELTDWDLTVVAPDVPGAAAYDGHQSYTGSRVRGIGRSAGARRWLPGMVARTAHLALANRPDLILCGHPVDGLSAALLQRVARIPYFVICYARELRSPRLRVLLPAVFARAQRILTISRFATREVLALGVPENRIRQLPLGFDPHRFDTVAPSRFAQELDLAGRPYLLTVSRLNDRYKGVDTVLRALPRIAVRVPEVRYVVAGEGRLRPRLEQLADQLGCRERVLFVGRISEVDLASLYAHCTAFVLMSRDSQKDGGVEGFGLVFLEANSFGKPVLGGNSGGIPDAVLDGTTGLLADPQSVSDVAQKAIRLLTDHHLAELLGREGRDRVLRDRSWSATTDRLRAIVREAL